LWHAVSRIVYCGLNRGGVSIRDRGRRYTSYLLDVIVLIG
jgi:hypothetical protein